MLNDCQHTTASEQQSGITSPGSNGVCLVDNRGIGNPVQRKANHTGLPDNLKSGIENLSGHSMDDVKVHYNSSQPAQLNAHAYAQGNQIHVAPGQEKHVAHEAWHVVQQKQGRVKPTTQLKGKVNVNDNSSLEKEADAMGAKALQLSSVEQSAPMRKVSPAQDVVQGVFVAPAPIIGGGFILRVPENAKLQQVRAYLNGMGAQYPFTTVHTVQLRVLYRRDNDPSPAYTNTNATGTVINVRLAEWFLRIASVGEITALIGHEIGVHTLAHDQMGGGVVTAERAINNPTRIRTGLHSHTLSPYVPGGRRQQDHVHVVKDTGAGPVATRPGGGVNQRGLQYGLAILRLGDQIENDPALAGPAHQAERDKRLQDLLKTYIFDHARMLVTDEGRPPMSFIKAHLISQTFNWYRNVVIGRYGALFPWLMRPAVQPTSSGWGLRAWLITKLSAWAITQARSTRRGRAIERGARRAGNRIGRAGRAVGRTLAPVVNTVGAIAAPVGRALAPVANAVGAVAAPVGRAAMAVAAPVGRAAAAVGGAALRATDFVYGEAENLVQNTVRGAWNLGRWALGY